MKKVVLFVIGLPIALLLWGFGNGVADVNSGQHSLLTLGVRATGMNLITKEGYKLGLRTNPEFSDRVDSIQGANEKREKEQKRRDKWGQ